MANNDLVYSINTDKQGIKTATVIISNLLSKEDYEAIWAGENGDSGFETEKVLNIRNLFEQFIVDSKWCDLQIWEEGNAFVNNVNIEKLEALRIAVEQFDNDTYELAERV